MTRKWIAASPKAIMYCVMPRRNLSTVSSWVARMSEGCVRSTAAGSRNRRSTMAPCTRAPRRPSSRNCAISPANFSMPSVSAAVTSAPTSPTNRVMSRARITVPTIRPKASGMTRLSSALSVPHSAISTRLQRACRSPKTRISR